MKQQNRIIVVGVGTGAPSPEISAHPDLARAEVVVAGKRILESVAPKQTRRIVVGRDAAGVLDEMAVLFAAGKRIVVLTSGDPLFFGFGARLCERFGRNGLVFHPAVSSMQTACARLGLAWNSVQSASAHGRNGFLDLAQAALDGGPICLLTDAVNTPGAAARFLLERGVTGYAVHVFAHLGEKNETCWGGLLKDAASTDFATPNVTLFLPKGARAEQPLCPGRPDETFAHERGLITKWPVRATVLAALGIEPNHIVWDLGAGSGSVAVEAAALARKGLVVAVEREEARVEHIRENRRRFGAANLEILCAALPNVLHDGVLLENGAFSPRPNRIFIGGGLGQNNEDADALLALAWKALLPGGRLVAACVLLSGMERARAKLTALCGDPAITLVQASDARPLGADVRLQAENPVFIVAAAKKATRAISL